MEIKKVVWASMLGALSIVIDVLFKLVIPSSMMGTPYYAIPIIIAAIFLGPKYSIPIAILGDIVSVMLVGDTPLPLFALASAMWGIIPGFLLKGKDNILPIVFVVLLTHFMASAINSIGVAVHFTGFNWTAALLSFGKRAIMFIPNTIIITLVVYSVLEPIKIRRNSDYNYNN